MNEVNIRVLAKELNLSIGTVSKALKDSCEISVQTKKRVLALAEKLRYQPNPYASSLRRKKSNTIAVVLPEVADSFFSVAIKGIEEVAQTKGYHVLVYLTYESNLKEKKILEEIKNGRVDGVLMSVSSETGDTSHIEALSNTVPLVFFDRSIDEIEAGRIITDDFESSYKATQHLIDRGCKKIVYLSISNSLSISTKRVAGFKAAMTDLKVDFDESNVVDCSNVLEQNKALLKKLLDSSQRPDGIMASVEKLIVPVYSICNDLNILIPEELKLICFSNLPYAPILNPSLTTITQPAYEMGKMAATILFQALDKRDFNVKKVTRVLPSELYLRRSTL